MIKSTSDTNRESASGLSNNLNRLLYEFHRDYARRIWQGIQDLGYADIRVSHTTVFENLSMGAVRVSELAGRTQVTQQAMGKMLKELERMGYVVRAIDGDDKRAKEIALSPRGIELAADYVKVIAKVRQHYAEKIGQPELNALESQLRTALDKVQLPYLPNAWTTQL